MLKNIFKDTLDGDQIVKDVSNIQKRLSILTNEKIWPSDKDFKVVSLSVARVQHVYQLDVRKIHK
jgi:hypothetical protein